jgi:hypothetical protein
MKIKNNKKMIFNSPQIHLNIWGLLYGSHVNLGMVSELFIMAGHMSNGSHVKRVTCQTGHMSNGSHVKRVTCQTGHMSNGSHVKHCKG